MSGRDVVIDGLNRPLNILEKTSVIQWETDFRVDGSSEDFLLFYKRGPLKLSGVYSFLVNSVLFETEEDLGRDIFEDKIYNDPNNIITCRQVETGKLDWEFPLSVYGTYFQNGEDHPMNLRKFLGIYEGVLYIRAGVRLLLGINVSSGKEVFKFTHGKELGGAMFIELDSEKGCIFSLNSTKYNEIDLKTNALSQYDIEEDIEKNKVNVSMLGSCEGGLISFYEGVDCNRFAVFSREEKKIVWTGEIEEVKDMFPAIIGMKHSGNKLYVHDIMKTLHIFELE
ncbi:hypothetical protein [Saccharicrinis aurantiacus]|uniref:hypothetical protein n=1 Tax=Saccharicrinis aurantiacus TaxID=1849719 RepID=UPI001C9E9DC8|nr:hypothetical protein [Saccharicrinis aurantiacus]